MKQFFRHHRQTEDVANRTITHRIHGAAIYGNMDPINIPQSC